MDDKMINKIIHVFSTILISLGYTYFISSRLPKGLFRFISLFPVLCIFTILPLQLPPVVSILGLTTIVTCQANFRLILFAFGKGPLLMLQEQSLHKFILYATIPIRNPSSKIPKITRKPPNFALEALVLAIDIATVAKYKQEMNPKLLFMCYGVFIFLGMDCTWSFSTFVLHSLLGIELEPLFDAPYLSTSLQNFWSKRWNLIVTNYLGQIVYKPVRSVSRAALSISDDLAQLPAIFATFLVSGLWHEMMYYYVTRKNPSWEMTLYFVLHGICVIMELVMKKGFKDRMHLPPFVSIPVTVGFWVFTCVWLVVPTLVKDGVDAMVIREILCVMDFFLNGMAFFMP